MALRFKYFSGKNYWYFEKHYKKIFLGGGGRFEKNTLKILVPGDKTTTIVQINNNK